MQRGIFFVGLPRCFRRSRRAKAPLCSACRGFKSPTHTERHSLRKAEAVSLAGAEGLTRLRYPKFAFRSRSAIFDRGTRLCLAVSRTASARQRDPRHAPRAEDSSLPLIQKDTASAKRRLCLWQGQKDLNPRHAVLETAALPTELYPYMVGLQGLEPGTIRL